MATRNGKTSDTTTSLAVIMNDIGYIKSDISDIKRTVEHGYVTKDEFEPIKRIVYGIVSLMLVAIVGAGMAVVLK